jgi:hypothetical protein
MSETIALYSRFPLTRADIEEIILERGGILTPREGPRIGRLSLDQQHIWLYEDDISNLRAWAKQDLYHKALFEAIRTKLGDEPRALFGIEISRTPGSGRLAVAFAQACADRWPCVVMTDQPTETEDDGINVFDKKDMLQLQKEGRGFLLYGM